MDLNNLSPQTTQLCMIGLGVLLVVLLSAWLLLQVMRGSLFRIAGLFIRTLTDPKDEPTKRQPINVPAHEREDLLAKAQDLDFDATVAKYRQGDEASAQSVPPPEHGLRPPPDRSFLQRKR